MFRFLKRSGRTSPTCTRSRREQTMSIQTNIGRRGFFATLAAAATATKGMAAAEKTQGAKVVKVVEFDAAGNRKGVVEVEKVVKTDAEWKKQLDPIQFDVTRHEGTERAGTGKYAYNHEDGLYNCICCGTTLFDSKTKFESGTGWPSFWQPIAKENVHTQNDTSLGMERSEVL